MKPFLSLLFFLSLYQIAAAQDRSQLENERKAIQDEIKEIQGNYNKVKSQKKETLGQLNLLQQRMVVQDKYINNINKDIKLINNDIYKKSVELNSAKRELDTLKLQYTRSVVYAYKNRSTYDYLNFIFSANSFNDALKRIAYLRSYRSYREQQVANIRETQSRIEQHRQQLLGTQTQKKSALENQTTQLDVLEEQKKEKANWRSRLTQKRNGITN